MNRTQQSLIAAVLALTSIASQAAAPAEEQRALNELRNTVVNLLQGLVEQGVIPREKAEQMVRDAQKRAAAEAEATAARDKAEEAAIRVPYVPQIVRDELRKQVEADLAPQVTQSVIQQAKSESWGIPAALPDWIKRMQWNGDLRFRSRSDFFAKDNASDTYINFLAVNQAGGIGKAGLAALANTMVDRQRLRERLRFGFEGDLGGGWSIAARLASGALNDPISTNQTLGNYFTRQSVGIDTAYLQWSGSTKTGLNAASITAGRIRNPYLSTNLVWDEDLMLEGVAANYRLGISAENPREHYVFLTVGAFPVQEVELAAGKWLYGAQLGESWLADGGSRLKLGAAYYRYENITGRRNAFGSNLLDYTAPQSLTRGNTLFDIRNDADPTTNLFALAAKYHLVDVTASFDWRVSPGHRMTFTANAVKNIGYRASDVFVATGLQIAPRTRGYQAEVGFGSATLAQSNAWRAYAGYRYLERDAVLDAFTDSDFHLGGTDAKGYFLGLEYSLTSRVSARGRFLSGREIDGPPLGVNVLQIDINASF